jgi:hypothetical protein
VPDRRFAVQRLDQFDPGLPGKGHGDPHVGVAWRAAIDLAGLKEILDDEARSRAAIALEMRHRCFEIGHDIGDLRHAAQRLSPAKSFAHRYPLWNL